MEYFGFFGAIIIGLSLGIVGGGGSILTVPILVYLFSIDTVVATAYSLFIVGITSLIGSSQHIKMGNIHWRTAIIFGIPSIVSVYLTRMYLIPLIPSTIGKVGGVIVTKSLFMLLIFAFLMILASYSMIKKEKENGLKKEPDHINYNYPLILIEGLFVGLITGLVGAGGGFLIIPALVILAKLPMKKAIGTSLIIIALKSLIGFIGDVNGSNIIDWKFLAVFTCFAIIGILIGSGLSKKISGEKLKPAFGYFVLIMGIFIITKELIFSR
jgi:uncharacterized protein